MQRAGYYKNKHVMVAQAQESNLAFFCAFILVACSCLTSYRIFPFIPSLIDLIYFIICFS